jgi:hypothetical protein
MLRKSAVRLILVGAVSAISLVGIMPTSANAWYITGRRGSVGSVGVPTAYVGMHCAFTCDYLHVGARVIHESPAYANRAQRICIRFRVLSFNANTLTYSLIQATWKCGWITASQDRIQDGGFVSNDYGLQAKTNFDVLVVWQLSGNVEVGRETINYDVGSDCANTGNLRADPNVYCYGDSYYDYVHVYR